MMGPVPTISVQKSINNVLGVRVFSIDSYNGGQFQCINLVAEEQLLAINIIRSPEHFRITSFQRFDEPTEALYV